MNLIRGRFHEEVDKLVTKYTASTPFDWRLYHHDITGSIAHAKMLAKQGIISPQETEIINRGLCPLSKLSSPSPRMEREVKGELKRGEPLLKNTSPSPC